MTSNPSEGQRKIKDEIIKEIKDDYFLVGRNSFIGGLAGFLTAAGFVSWTAALGAIRTDSAEFSKNEIIRYEKQSERLYENIKRFSDNAQAFEPLVQFSPASSNGCETGVCARITAVEESNPAELEMMVNESGSYLVYANYSCRSLQEDDFPGRYPEEFFFLNSAQLSRRYGYQLCHYDGDNLNPTSSIGRISHPITVRLSSGDNLKFMATGWGNDVNQYRVIELYAVRIFP